MKMWVELAQQKLPTARLRQSLLSEQVACDDAVSEVKRPRGRKVDERVGVP